MLHVDHDGLSSLCGIEICPTDDAGLQATPPTVADATAAGSPLDAAEGEAAASLDAGLDATSAADASDDAAPADAAGDDAAGDDASADAAPLAGFAIGGTISGLASGQTVALQNNKANKTIFAANGAFSFSKRLAAGDSYEVTALVTSGPNVVTDFICGITANGAGTVGSADVTNVVVTCHSRCILFEGCVDVQNQISIMGAVLSVSGTRLGTHPGDCVNYTAQNGTNLYNADGGVFLVDGNAYFNTSTAPVMVSVGASFGLVTPAASSGTPPAVSTATNGSFTTARGSVDDLQGGSIVLDDSAGFGAAYYEVYICE